MRQAGGELTTFDISGVTGRVRTCGINASATVVGLFEDSAGTHGFLRNDDGQLEVFDVPGSKYTVPIGINDSGLVTGWYWDANRKIHGFLRIP